MNTYVIVVCRSWDTLIQKKKKKKKTDTQAKCIIAYTTLLGSVNPLSGGGFYYCQNIIAHMLMGA
jgi:hypothetical protein